MMLADSSYISLASQLLVIRLSSIPLEGELRAKAIPALPAKIARNVESHLGMDRG